MRGYVECGAECMYVRRPLVVRGGQGVGSSWWWVRWGWNMVVEVWSVFFFSSRRRHTRFDCDWSSDVCSSDLHVAVPGGQHAIGTTRVDHELRDPGRGAQPIDQGEQPSQEPRVALQPDTAEEIGRASCRERV